MQRIVEPPLDRSHQPNRCNTREKGVENQLQLEACQHLSETSMDSVPKCDVRAGLATDVELLRAVPAAGVAIRRRQKQQDFAALRHDHAVDFDISRRGPEKRLYGRVPAKRLLDCLPGERGLLTQAPPLIRKIAKRIQHVAEGAYGGIDTGG